jgi:hypothetical protein
VDTVPAGEGRSRQPRPHAAARSSSNMAQANAELPTTATREKEFTPADYYRSTTALSAAGPGRPAPVAC